MHHCIRVGHTEHCRPIFQCSGLLTPRIKENCSAYYKRRDVHHTHITPEELETFNFNIPQYRLTKFQKCFPVSATKLINRNRLPEEIESWIRASLKIRYIPVTRLIIEASLLSKWAGNRVTGRYTINISHNLFGFTFNDADCKTNNKYCVGVKAWSGEGSYPNIPD